MWVGGCDAQIGGYECSAGLPLWGFREYQFVCRIALTASIWCESSRLSPGNEKGDVMDDLLVAGWRYDRIIITLDGDIAARLESADSGVQRRVVSGHKQVPVHRAQLRRGVAE